MPSVSLSGINSLFIDVTFNSSGLSVISNVSALIILEVVLSCSSDCTNLDSLHSLMMGQIVLKLPPPNFSLTTSLFIFSLFL